MKRHLFFYILAILLGLFSKANGQIPTNYYAGTERLYEGHLKVALNHIIKGHILYTYTSSATKDTWDILKETDADPQNPNNVILVYSGQSTNAAQEYNGGQGWSREHIWPTSCGDFNTSRGIGTDLHNLKPISIAANSARGTKWFDYSTQPFRDTGSKYDYGLNTWEPRDDVKGDVARIIFYMATRYDNLDFEIVNFFPDGQSVTPQMALLSTLLEWHRNDPPDDFERRRNNVIYAYQNNRNPFIDHPEFVDYIWDYQNSVNTEHVYTTATLSRKRNYIRTISPREPLTEIPKNGFRHNETVDYFDGLGRPSQSVQVKASPNYKDIVQPVVYDDFGRESEHYLPYASHLDDGNYRTAATAECIDFYTSLKNDTHPYSLTEFDNSPLNRIRQQTGAGDLWHQNNKGIQYKDKTNTNAIISWDEDGKASPYPARSLYIREVRDEDGKINRTYTDKQGQVVLKENLVGNEIYQTHYIYDDFGLLRTIVPPKASSPADTKLCYYYKYDGRKRMIAKKIPGADWVYMVYDKRDRLALVQDGNMRRESQGMFAFTAYDELNRPVMTGIMNVNYSMDDIREKYHNFVGIMNTMGNGLYGYTTSQWSPYDNSVSEEDILTVIWYDDYGFRDNLYASLDLAYDKVIPPSEYEAAASSKIKGAITGTMTKVLTPENSGAPCDNQELISVFYYDDYSNITKTVNYNHKGGYDITHTLYEPITQLPLKEEHIHQISGKDDLKIKRQYAYDHMGRLLHTMLQINEQTPVRLNEMAYNAIGELSTKHLHKISDNNYAQSIDYSYNIRGWLTQINDHNNPGNDLFAMELFYNDVQTFNAGMVQGNNTAIRQYNGNIAAIKWKQQDNVYKDSYSFEYDELNRLRTASNYYGIDSNDPENAYDLNSVHLAYDKNGNIKNLTRFYAEDCVDALLYCYHEKSNQIGDIRDYMRCNEGMVEGYCPRSSSPYTYDLNGNTTFDPGKNTSIKYNHLNLPECVTFDDGKLFYHYDAAGNKLAQSIETSSGTPIVSDYIGNIICKDDALAYITSEEGRLIPDNGHWHYEYALRDHLGNARAVFLGTDTGAVLLQTTDYYPFGLIVQQNNYKSNILTYTNNNYLYSGKELQTEGFAGVSLGWYDFHARHYDPASGLWLGIDPLAEKYPDIAPYVYCGGNPISFVDPDGMRKVYYNDDGTYKETTHNNWFHNFFRGNQIYVENTQGEYTNISQAAFENWQSDIDRKAWFSRSIDYHFTPGSSEINPLTGQVLQGGALVNISPEFAILSMGVGTLSSSLKLTAKTAAKSLTDDAVRVGVNAAKTGTQGFKSLGAAGRGFNKVLQSGGQSLKPNTLKALNLTKDQGRNAIHALKSDLRLPNNFHGKIMGNGDYLHPSTGKWLGNLFDYVY